MKIRDEMIDHEQAKMIVEECKNAGRLTQTGEVRCSEDPDDYLESEIAVWFDDQGNLVGRELEDDEQYDLTEEDVVKVIDDGGFSVVVKGDPGYRHYVNMLAPGEHLYEKGFEIPADLPGLERLLHAIDNAGYKIIRTMDGKLDLVETEMGDTSSINAQVALCDNDTFKILKTLEDEYDIVPSEGGYKLVEKEEEEVE
jgi:hypothetical protein